jgi:pyruvate,water dikinase
MSHSAICAREFAIPCVVGTQVGTQQIPDGATITVDGTAGTVRVGATNT